MELLNEVINDVPVVLEEVVNNSDTYDLLLSLSNKMDYLINLVFVFLVIYTLINVIKYLYVLLHGFTKI